MLRIDISRTITCTVLLAIVSLAGLSGCRDAAEFFHWAGTPTGQDGWLHDYDSTPNDTWEAFRVIMRDNGSITTEDPAKMELRGVYKPHDSSARDGIEVKGTVYDKSEDGEVRSRLIVHCWYARNANDRERPDTAREYCNAVFRLLKAWKGEPIDEKPTVSTTGEEPVAADEGIGFFKVTPAQAFSAAELVIKTYGSVEQSEAATGFIRGQKKNALEKTVDEVRVNIYDRTEGDKTRVKVSVKVRSGDGNKAMQDVARSYVAEIQRELEKRHGKQD